MNPPSGGGTITTASQNGEESITTAIPSLAQETTNPQNSLLPNTEEAPAKAVPQSLVQKVEINVEPNPLKSFLIRLFLPRLRRLHKQSEWNKWFLVTRGITAQMQEALGVGNSKVGYVYLVDSKCRVRWAGSGRAEEGERSSLLRGVGRLVEEWRKERDAERTKGAKSVEKGAVETIMASAGG